MGGGAHGDPIAVVTRRIASQSFVDHFTALGTARSNESIDVTARISSIVTAIRFREGQRVRTGDVLVTLESRQESASLSLAEAQEKQAENQFARSRTLAATRAVSAADLEQFEANLMVARAGARRHGSILCL